MALFNHVDPIVWEAARTPHLGIEKLPPLADEDDMKNLAHRSFEVRVHDTVTCEESADTSVVSGSNELEVYRSHLLEFVVGLQYVMFSPRSWSSMLICQYMLSVWEQVELAGLLVILVGVR